MAALVARKSDVSDLRSRSSYGSRERPTSDAIHAFLDVSSKSWSAGNAGKCTQPAQAWLLAGHDAGRVQSNNLPDRCLPQIFPGQPWRLSLRAVGFDIHQKASMAGN